VSINEGGVRETLQTHMSLVSSLNPTLVYRHRVYELRDLIGGWYP